MLHNAKYESEKPDISALLESFRHPASLLDLDYRIKECNRQYSDLYGDGKPMQGRQCHQLFHGLKVPCDQAGLECPVHACLETGDPQRMLHVHHTPRGEEYVDIEIRPIRNAQGEITFFLEIQRQLLVPAHRKLVGKASAFTRMLAFVNRVAASDTTALLLGESGTGKELVAQTIHDASDRAGRPLVTVECSGLSESLFESELFGHQKGAFTGAYTRKIGLVEAAEGGTLFLDEIGDIPLLLQVKLLRLLETGMYRRVGSVEAMSADFRLICATNQNLKAMVEEGTFRQDLYYRISAFPILLPPLRERITDLPLLIEALLQRFPQTRSLSLSTKALACLKAYSFPGNIRELQNILERAALLADGDAILPEHLPPEVIETYTPSEESDDPEEILPLQVIEERYLRRVLARFPEDRNMLARKLGISERTLYRKTQALRIH